MENETKDLTKQLFAIITAQLEAEGQSGKWRAKSMVARAVRLGEMTGDIGALADAVIIIAKNLPDPIGNRRKPARYR